jgi:hypothetical protein
MYDDEGGYTAIGSYTSIASNVGDAPKREFPIGFDLSVRCAAAPSPANPGDGTVGKAKQIRRRAGGRSHRR